MVTVTGAIITLLVIAPVIIVTCTYIHREQE